MRSIEARDDSFIEDLLERQGFCSIHLDVIAWEDDGEWIALALEMNLHGYGRALGQAFEDLQSAVLAQLAFAYFKGNPDLIWRPSDPIWRTRFDETREKHLKRWLMGESVSPGPYRLARLHLPPREAVLEVADYVPDPDEAQ